jgi:hypothetical protein
MANRGLAIRSVGAVAEIWQTPQHEQIPAKLHDPGSCPGQAFADKDLLQHIDLARFLFDKVIPP